MNRIALMVLRNIPIVPGAWFKLCHYAKNTDKYSEEEKYAHIRYILQCGVRGGNINLHIYGEENIPDGAALLYSNHQGLFDVVAAVVACEKPISAVFKKELENLPLIKQIAVCLKGLPMDRNDARQSLGVIQTVTEEVLKGRKYIIYPEGTRSKLGNKMLDFHAGSFRCAVKAKCPIVPVAVIDTYKVFDTKNSKPVDCQLRFLTPIQPEEYEGMKAGEVADLVKGRIQEALDQYAEV